MFDFSLSNINTDNPSPLSVLYALLLSFFLAALISFTYEKTTNYSPSRSHFIQAMILGSIIAAIVAQAIGDSIGRGLGMLGVLAMIRFRTNIYQPRNIIFIFAALASGISCGVFAFNIALYGCILFCLLAFLLHWSPLGNYPRNTQTIRVSFDDTFNGGEALIKDYFGNLKIKAHLVRIDLIKEASRTEKEFTWEISSENKINTQELFDALSTTDHVKSVRFNMRSEQEII